MNSNETDALGSFTSDGLTLFFYSSRPGGEGGNDIYMATRTGTDQPLGNVTNLGAEINTSSGDSSAFLSGDGLTLYFESNRPGGVGDNDLWMATRTSPEQPFGNVSLLENVNSASFDGAPSVSSDGLTLFFNSFREPNGELFVAMRSSIDQPFGTPINLNDFSLGSNVNTARVSELSPYISPNWPAPGSKLYFSHVNNPSERNVFNISDWDIYEATWVVPPFTNTLLPAAIYAVVDSDVDSVFDDLGDQRFDLSRIRRREQWSVGEMDTESENRVERLVAKFELPANSQFDNLLEAATLRIFLEGIEGTPPGPISVFHSINDNSLFPVVSDYEEPSYTDTLLDLVKPIDEGQQFYEVDVTEWVLADYATDGDELLIAFRLQVNEAVFLEDDQGHYYQLTMPGSDLIMNHPQFVLTFGVLLGDMDCDGDVDFDDIDDFVLALNNPVEYEAMYGVPPELKGDIDGDGDNDFDDINDFVAILNAPDPLP